MCTFCAAMYRIQSSYFEVLGSMSAQRLQFSELVTFGHVIITQTSVIALPSSSSLNSSAETRHHNVFTQNLIVATAVRSMTRYRYYSDIPYLSHHQYLKSLADLHLLA